MGAIRDYSGLLKALDARRKELGLSHLALDDMAGLPAGYTGKLFTKADKRNARVLGRESFGAIVQALGLDMVAIPSAARHKVNGHSEQGVSPEALSARMKKIGRKGGLAAMGAKHPRAFRAHQRKAARCRWAKWRMEKRKAEALKARQQAQEAASCPPRHPPAPSPSGSPT